MKILVTGSAGHLGEALVRTLKSNGDEIVGIDIKSSPFTSQTGSIADRQFVRKCMAGVDTVLHTATLHKPHVATHTRQDFVDTNITGSLNLLEEAVRGKVKSFVYTSTTSTFGDALQPKAGGPAVWVTEALRSKPKNIYGVTKTAAEELCKLFHRNEQLPCIVLRTSRFFPENDDNKTYRDTYTSDNLKASEFLFRRVDIHDVVTAHQRAIEKASDIGFACFIISATTPFNRIDTADLGIDAPAVVKRYVPDYQTEYARRGWAMFPTIGRIYDNTHARELLGWVPRYDFQHVVEQLGNNQDFRSQLAMDIGSKGYHDVEFSDGPYPVN